MSGSFDLTNRVRLEVLDQSIVTGAVPDARAVASRLSLEEAVVIDAFRLLGEGHVYVLEPSDPTRLRMANPFSAIPSSFSVTAKGRQYFGNCVWDSLGIVALLGGDGSVATRCPDCRENLHLTVAGGELVDAMGIVHFSVPAARWWDDIVFT